MDISRQFCENVLQHWTRLRQTRHQIRTRGFQCTLSNPLLTYKRSADKTTTTNNEASYEAQNRIQHNEQVEPKCPRLRTLIPALDATDNTFVSLTLFHARRRWHAVGTQTQYPVLLAHILSCSWAVFVRQHEFADPSSTSFASYRHQTLMTAYTREKPRLRHLELQFVWKNGAEADET